MFKKKACPKGKSVKILKEENQQYEYVSPQQAVLAKRSSHPLFSIPCVSTAMVRGDSLHILYSRGWGPIWQEAFCTICAFMTGLKGKEPALPPGSRRSLPGSKSFTVKENHCQAHKFEALHGYRHTEATQGIPMPGGQGSRSKTFLAMPGGGGEGKPS